MNEIKEVVTYRPSETSKVHLLFLVNERGHTLTSAITMALDRFYRDEVEDEKGKDNEQVLR